MQDNGGYKLSVTQLNEYVSSMFKNDILLSRVCVSGEISGFKRHSSGHLYFSLKDGGALVRCVMFRQSAFMLDFSPEDGQSVTVRGSVSLYVKDGQYQLYADSMRREGEGELYRRFVLLKTRLEARGYFLEEHKKPIPGLPKCVGIVTSPTGAAVQDIINIIRRRYPKMDMLLCPVQVQGESAAGQIAAGIRRMNLIKKADVLIVGRGGGSMEDLWPFNEEEVARAVYESNIPVISAVGHETDFTICDFVADLRAPTPSAAAELCVPEYFRLREDVLLLRDSIAAYGRGNLAAMHRELANISELAAFTAVRHKCERMRNAIAADKAALTVDVRAEIANALHSVEKQASRLEALSPDGVMARGYGMVRIGGKYASGIEDLAECMSAELIMRGGKADITIESIIKDS